MAALLDLFSWLMLLGGVAFSLIGGVGLLRMPDFYTRLHAASVTDTLGAGLILLGLMVQAGWTLVSVKLLLILVFMWFTGPIATHALARAALVDPANPRPLLHEEPPPSKSSSISSC
ncbi:MAG TPA: monovalent cation/H(+) antiporter subunit G [Xanthomonadaceae bacterium]|nr:monovalent cation/H(+) antiporter subunit G [Xanthomonadaceae bacterium]